MYVLFFAGGIIGICYAMIDYFVPGWIDRHRIAFFPIGILFLCAGITTLRNIEVCAEYVNFLRTWNIRASLQVTRLNLVFCGLGMCLIGLVVMCFALTRTR